LIYKTIFKNRKSKLNQTGSETHWFIFGCT